MKKQASFLLKNSSLLITLFLLTALIGCNQSEYDKLVKTEMNTGVVNESLLFNMKFGQTRQEFFDQCWKLNKEGIITQGPKNNFVQYELPMKEGDSVHNKITMLFYGIFNEEKIMTGMDFKFNYVAWAPWNRTTQSDHLVPVIKDSLKSWFPGNDFITLPSKKGEGEVHLKIDGNRRIMIEPIEDAREINARIDDLRYALKDSYED